MEIYSGGVFGRKNAICSRKKYAQREPKGPTFVSAISFLFTALSGHRIVCHVVTLSSPCSPLRRRVNSPTPEPSNEFFVPSTQW